MAFFFITIWYGGRPPGQAQRDLIMKRLKQTGIPLPRIILINIFAVISSLASRPNSHNIAVFIQSTISYIVAWRNNSMCCSRYSNKQMSGGLKEKRAKSPARACSKLTGRGNGCVTFWPKILNAGKTGTRDYVVRAKRYTSNEVTTSGEYPRHVVHSGFRCRAFKWQ